jgi:hypothetical protein
MKSRLLPLLVAVVAAVGSTWVGWITAPAAASRVLLWPAFAAEGAFTGFRVGEEAAFYILSALNIGVWAGVVWVLWHLVVRNRGRRRGIHAA